MKRISVPIEIPREELDAWADRVAGESLDAGLRRFAAAGLVGRDSSERTVLDLATQAPLSAHISISISGRDGFTKATYRRVDKDLDGRTVHHATQFMSQSAPFLQVAWERLKAKHSVDLEQLIAWLSQSEFFPPTRRQFVREGLAAWLAGDMVKAIHVLVPQIEAALRDVLAALGGVVTRPNLDVGGFQMISLGEVLSHARFREKVSEDIRFHFRVLYRTAWAQRAERSGPRYRRLELFGLGLANMVVHSIVVIGTFRVERKPEGGATARAARTDPA